MRNFGSTPPSSSHLADAEVVALSENKPLKNYDLVQSDIEPSEVISELGGVVEISEKQDDTTDTAADTPQGAKKENGKVKKLLEDLSDSDTRRIERYIKEGKPDKAALHIAGLGLPMTSQEELVKHFTQYLEDGIRRIAWTGKRLAYAVAILEYTLESEGNKNITSVENLIQNYLIFCKTFKEYEDNKIPRYGQFSYVMRSIFAGITSKEEIEEIIRKHKTFGQKTELTEEELGELHTTAKEVRRDFLEAKKKKLDLDRSMDEALQEEHEEKGKVWSWKFSAPREYEFPNYTFQTGEKKGQNKSVGRSSWEPLFEAYADTVNKKIEDRISKKEVISKEEKERRIKETRIELLYEKFEFPVGIRTDKNGNSKPIVYILDFVDINRWRGIEIKGPLTPKAAEKIRLFQKYYVEGDFSDLPKDEQIIMMEYVQDALDGVRDYCIKNDHPVFNQFSALDVLGMYKWDYDLNNFNKYEEARYMKELSVKERQQLQKGFIPLIEDRIKTRKDFPDIRPQEYVQSDRLPKVEDQNKKDAKKEGISYVVEGAASTRPYDPQKIVGHILDEYHALDSENYLRLECDILREVISTLPVEQGSKNQIVNLKKMSNVTGLVDDEINYAIRKKQDFIDRVQYGKSSIEFTVSGITQKDFEDAISTLTLFRRMVMSEGFVSSLHDYSVSQADIIKTISASLDFYNETYDVKKRKFKITSLTLEKNQNLQEALKKIEKIGFRGIVDSYVEYFFGKYRIVAKNRVREVGLIIDKNLLKNGLSGRLTVGEINSRLDLIFSDPIYYKNSWFTMSHLLIDRFVLEEKISDSAVSALQVLLSVESLDYKMDNVIPWTNLMGCMDQLKQKYRAKKVIANEIGKDRPPQEINRIEKFLERIETLNNQPFRPDSNFDSCSKEEIEVIKLIAENLLLEEIEKAELDRLVLRFKSELELSISRLQSTQVSV